MLDLEELQVEVARQRVDVLVDGLHPQRLQRVQPVLQAGDAEEVDGAVLEAAARPALSSIALKKRSYVEDAEVLLVAGDGDGAAAPVELVQHADVLVAEQQRAQPGRVPEHLVERQRDEVGVHRRQVQAVRRNEGRRVQQHQPFVALRVRGRREKRTSWK